MKSHNEEKRIRPDILTVAVLFSAALMMVFGIVTQRIFGDRGAFFAAGPMSIYLLFYLALVLSVQKAVYIMVRLRARRSQYLNAETNMIRSLRIFGIAGALTGILLICLSYIIAGRIFGADRGFIQILIAGAAVIFLGVQGVLRGYLQGIGYTRPIMIADILVALVSFIVGTIMSEILYSYGLKVNDLFHLDEFSAVYGSIGMLTGILAGAIVGFVQILVSYNLRKREIADFVKTGAPRYLDNKNDVLVGIRPLILLYSTPALMLLVDECFFCLHMRRTNPDLDYMALYGILSGRIVNLTVLLSVVSCIPFVKSLNRIMARFERDEFEGARERFRHFMRFANMLFMPVSIFLLASSETMIVSFFGKSSKLADQLAMMASAVVYLCAFAIALSWLLSHMGKSVVTMLNIAAGWGVHILSIILFGVVMKMGLYGIVLSWIVPFLVYDILCLLEISKILSNRQEFFRTFLLPLASSATAGILVFLLNKLLVNLIGDVLTLLVCAIVYWFAYMMAMILLRGIRAHELYKVPLGGLLLGIARMIQTEEDIED